MNAAQLGRYELVRKVAAGGTAEVFLARLETDAGFRRHVAVKRLYRHFAHHADVLASFQIEARLLAGFHHAGVPQVFDLGRGDGTWFMAMEWIAGLNVAELWQLGVQSGAVMPMPVALGIAVQVAAALEHVHEARGDTGEWLRVVHRDVTPENVMVTRDGVAKLIDFGVAHSATHTPEGARAVKGTFSYMAPEQVQALPCDRRVDVFALGVLVYELTTGTRLFRGTDVDVMRAIVEDDAPRPATRATGYPSELEGVVLRALARDRGRRYPTAAAFAADLEHVALRLGWPLGTRLVARHVGDVLGKVSPTSWPWSAVPVAGRPEVGGAGPGDEPDDTEIDDAPTLTTDGARTGVGEPVPPTDPSQQTDWPTPAVFDLAFLPRRPSKPK